MRENIFFVLITRLSRQIADDHLIWLTGGGGGGLRDGRSTNFCFPLVLHWIHLYKFRDVKHFFRFGWLCSFFSSRQPNPHHNCHPMFRRWGDTNWVLLDSKTVFQPRIFLKIQFLKKWNQKPRGEDLLTCWGGDLRRIIQWNPPKFKRGTNLGVARVNFKP